MMQQNPQMLQQLIAELGQSNPEMLQVFFGFFSEWDYFSATERPGNDSGDGGLFPKQKEQVNTFFCSPGCAKKCITERGVLHECPSYCQVPSTNAVEKISLHQAFQQNPEMMMQMLAQGAGGGMGAGMPEGGAMPPQQGGRVFCQ